MATKAEIEQENEALRQRLAELEGAVVATVGVSPEPPRFNIQIGVKRNDYNYGFVEVNFGASGVTAENKEAVLDEANDIFEALFLKFVGKVEASVEGGEFRYEKTISNWSPLPASTSVAPQLPDPFVPVTAVPPPPIGYTQEDVAAHYGAGPEAQAIMEQDQKWGSESDEEYVPFVLPDGAVDVGNDSEDFAL